MSWRKILAALGVAVAAMTIPCRSTGGQERVIIEHATVVHPDKGGETGRTIVIEKGLITAVTGSYQPKPGDQVIDGSGGFVIAGLWDLHIHAGTTGAEGLRAMARAGVTGARDMGGDLHVIDSLRKEITAGRIQGPWILTPGPVFESIARYGAMQQQGSHEKMERTRVAPIDTADAKRLVDSMARIGADFIKIRSVATEEMYLAIARAARRRGLQVTGHPVVTVRAMAEGGQASVEHMVWPQVEMAEGDTQASLLEAIRKSRIAFVPTMVVLEHSLTRDQREKTNAATDKEALRARGVSEYMAADWMEQAQYPDDSQDWTVRRGTLMEITKRLLKTGVRVLPGTDAGMVLVYPDDALVSELELMTKDLGMSAGSALRSATLSAAEFLGLEGQAGTVEAGKNADLVILGANPLENISALRLVRAVILAGHVIRSEK